MKVSTLTLGGRCWDLPHLPWKVCRVVEPAIMRYYRELIAANMAISDLPPEIVTDLVDAMFLAISHVDRTLSREEFDDLPFSLGALASAIPDLAPAAGLKVISRGEGDGTEGESLGEL